MPHSASVPDVFMESTTLAVLIRLLTTKQHRNRCEYLDTLFSHFMCVDNFYCSIFRLNSIFQQFEFLFWNIVYCYVFLTQIETYKENRAFRKLHS